MASNKCIHYLLRTEKMTDEEFEEIKEKYRQKGIKVVVLSEGKRNIHEGLRGMLLNHG